MAVTGDKLAEASRLISLREAHRDLDAAIDALRNNPVPDQLQLARLKKRKLRLKDEIAMLEDAQIPDIIA
ncbi:MAG: YdcH family protein [Sphingomonadales bacterium]